MLRVNLCFARFRSATLHSLSFSLEQMLPPIAVSPRGPIGDRVYSNGHVRDLDSNTATALPLGSNHEGRCENGSKEHIHGMSEVISDVPHDVDLCLVSPCEFQHPKTPENHQHHISPSLATDNSPDPSNNNNNHSQGQSNSDCLSAYSQETPPTSVSESLLTATDSDVPPNTEECPSITADTDSDDESSSPFPSSHSQDHPSQHYSHMGVQLSSHDPPPAPVKDLPPLPPQPLNSLIFMNTSISEIPGSSSLVTEEADVNCSTGTVYGRYIKYVFICV